MRRLVSSIIEKEVEHSRIVVLIGQRQVGKTYELQRLKKKHEKSLYFDFENEDDTSLFGKASVSFLERIIGSRNADMLLLMDEIHKLPKVGSILKLIHDHFPKVRVLASGSASFLLLSNLGDSLYGRKTIIEMFPLTFREILGIFDTEFGFGGFLEINRMPKVEALARDMAIYGSLPRVFLTTNRKRKQRILKDYIESLLFKDIFEIEGIRKPRVFKQLLKLLALQVGNEVNPNEIAQQLGISRNTVLEYIDLYEKFQIVYSIPSYSTNPRNEVKKSSKVYFVDLGIRNAVIGNFLGLENRTDSGALFENLVMNTFRCNISYFDQNYEMYFWRNFNNFEVDLVLLNRSTDELIPIEIKYSKLTMPSRSFSNAYKDRIDREFGINKDNLWVFV